MHVCVGVFVSVNENKSTPMTLSEYTLYNENIYSPKLGIGIRRIQKNILRIYI